MLLCDSVLDHVCMCIFIYLVNFYTKHVPSTKKTLQKLSIGRVISDFISVQLLLLFNSLLSIFLFFGVCIYTYQIKHDFQIMTLRAHIIPPASVVIGKQ